MTTDKNIREINRHSFIIAIKKLDIVMLIAWLLAILSMFFIAPDSKYMSYIDFRSLGILWGLMVIIQGLKKNGVFEWIASFLLSKVKNDFQLAFVLVFLCFCGSMIITNDVSLITFVPFAIMILKSCNRENLMIPVVVLQTIAANLGSMLTPIGNPQNLYMYGFTGMGIIEFLSIMLPYSILSAVLLLTCTFLTARSNASLNHNNIHINDTSKPDRLQIIIYILLFLAAMLTVLRIIPWYVFCIILLFVVLIMDHGILAKADYTLLITFIGFFIFTGNMGRITVISEFFRNVINEREFFISIIASQVISNVPATLMLSGFANNYRELIIGVNVGGLGTLIASMASLISYKAYTKEYRDKTSQYIFFFTILNVLFLIPLVILWMFIH